MIKLFSLFFVCLICSFSVVGFEVIQYPSYESHRENFEKSLGRLKNYTVYKLIWPNRSTPELSTVVAVAKNKNAKPKKIIVISSGIHGVEGFVGSSLQQAFISEYLQTSLPEFDYAFVHLINPWGMKNNRRVNNENVDLNRNFLVDNNDFKIKNESYEKIDRFLNPNVPLNFNFTHQFMFILDSIYYIMKFSMESLRQAVLQGQYHTQRGIYFGGYQHDALKARVDEFVDSQLSGYKEVIWIDLHTGYGERGRLHLLANSSEDENSKRLLQLLPNQKIDFGNDKKFYKTTGDMISYLSHKITTQRFTGVVFEFGTMDSQKPLGSIESLRRMVVENQSYHYGLKAESRKDIEGLLLDMFNPQDQDWWRSISVQSKETFDMILNKKN